MTLSAQPEVRERSDRVAELIEGFKTPSGLELLASVHWVARREDDPARDPESATAAVRRWTPRKAHLFQPEQVRVAWDRLAEQGWLG